MVRTVCVALLSLLLAVCAFGQAPNWSAGVVYEYDGSGNVRKIGTDTYVYDTAQRLVRGSLAGSQQSYTYDSFGNRKTCQPAGGGDCQYGFTVDSTTNRVEGRLYDKRGNMLQLPEGNTLEYDELGMVRKETGVGRAVYYIYTADDERIAVYDADTQLGSHQWEWTVRGLDKKPLREFKSAGTSGTDSFRWAKDHIWRDSVLLASRQPDSGAPGGVSTYHYHVDHLGTPRQVTSSASVIVGRHDYLPFGPELSSTRSDEPKLQDLKFTGHERDEVRDRPPLDYMHARYYEPRLGRFLSVDPILGSAPRPQSWNRYAYVGNNPIGAIDPTGMMAATPEVAAALGEKCQILCAKPAERKAEPAQGGAHATVTVSAKDPGWFGALLYRVGLKATLGQTGREFTEAEVAAMMGQNALSSHLMLGGKVNRTLTGVVIVGPFSIRNWEAYPATVPRPAGPFQVLYGEEYAAARTAANNANRALHRADPSLAGKQIHEIQPVKFGGSPTDAANKIALTPGEHSAVSTWWSRFLRGLND